MKLKYIIDEANGFSIFPPYVDHDVAARPMQARGFSIVGAGFIEIFNGEVTCYGKSQSLQINSRGSVDSEIIAYSFDLKSS